jgi:hypothetical protein
MLHSAAAGYHSHLTPSNKNISQLYWELCLKYHNCVTSRLAVLQLDAQMVYKMALAWQVTGDTRYASQVLSIINGWATTNKDWGWHW